MSSDVFFISSACDPNPALAIWQAAELAGISVSRIQDAVFGLDLASAYSQLDTIGQAAGLTCSSVAVSSALRALSFSAATILSDDSALSVVVGSEAAGYAAILLASPETVGLLNLLPRARIAARSLSGPEPALRLAGLTVDDIQLSKEGNSLILLHNLLDELEAQSAHWGMASSGDLAILIERI